MVVSCVDSHRPNGTRVTREAGGAALRNHEWEGGVTKMCWTTLTEKTIAWAICCSPVCVPEFPTGGRDALPRRTSWVMTSSACTRGTAILI